MVIEYYVNEEKKTVVAKFQYEDEASYYVRQKLKKSLEVLNMFDWIVDSFYDIVIDACSELDKMLYDVNKVRGVAKCHENDKWNEEVGKKVAKAKLLRNYNYRCFKIFRKAKDVINEIQKQSISNVENKLRKYKDNCIKYDNYLIEEDYL